MFYIGTITLGSYFKLTCNSKWPVLCGREMVGRLYRHMIARRKLYFPEMLDSVIDSLSHWKIELFARNIQVAFFHSYYCFFSFAFSLFPSYSLAKMASCLFQHFSSLHWFPFPSAVRHSFLSLPHFSYILIFNHQGPGLLFIICLILCVWFFLVVLFFSSCLHYLSFLTSSPGLLISFWTSSAFPFPFNCFKILCYDLWDSSTTSTILWFCLYTEIPILLYLTRQEIKKQGRSVMCVLTESLFYWSVPGLKELYRFYSVNYTGYFPLYGCNSPWLNIYMTLLGNLFHWVFIDWKTCLQMNSDGFCV